MMNRRDDRLTRRSFVAIAGALFAGLFVPGALDAHSRHDRRKKGRRKGRHQHSLHMYRWTGQGRRASRAALAHAANRRYATVGAALRDRPHPHAHLRLVRLDVSVRTYFRLFVSRRRFVVDLRHL